MIYESIINDDEIHISHDEAERLKGASPNLKTWALLVSPPDENKICKMHYVSPVLYKRILKEIFS